MVHCIYRAWPCTAAEAAAFLRYYNEIQQGYYKRLTKRLYRSAYTTPGRQNYKGTIIEILLQDNTNGVSQGAFIFQFQLLVVVYLFLSYTNLL